MTSPRSFLLLQLLLLAFVFAARAQGLPWLLGGLTEANENDEGVQHAIRFAMSQFNQASNDMFGSRVVRVLRARKQLVAGMKYLFEVEIRRTTCLKSVADLASCPDHVDPALKKHSICEFEVYSIPWQGKNSLLKTTCRDV